MSKPDHPPESDRDSALDALVAAAWKGVQARPAAASRFKFKPFSRRNFIIGSVAGLATASVAAEALGEPTPTFHPDPAEPNRRLTVKFDEMEWVIEARWFGDDARVDYRDLQDGRHWIRLRRAKFPGTVLPANFEATFSRRGGLWFFAIEPDGRTAVETRLARWMKGDLFSLLVVKEGEIARFEDATLSVGRGGATLTVGRDLSPTLTAVAQPLMFKSGPIEFSATTATLSVDRARHSLVPADFIGNRASDGLTQITLGSVTWREANDPLGQIFPSHQIRCELPQVSAFIHAFVDRGRDTGLLSINGSGAVEVRSTGRAAPAVLRADQICLLVDLARMNDRLILAAQLASQRFGIASRNVAVTLEHREQCGILAALGSQEVRAFHVTAGLVTAHVPVGRVSGADFQFKDTPILITFGEELPLAAGSAEEMFKKYSPVAAGQVPPGKPATLHIGRRTRLVAPVGSARLHLQRNLERLDLQFEFPDFELKVEQAGAQLERPGAGPGLMIVHFPPQHVYEEARLDQLLAKDEGPRAIQRPAIGSGEVGAWLSETRVAGPTRLAFNVDRPSPWPLDLNFLTEWKELALVVHERALPRDADLPTQLRVAKTESLTPLERDKAREAIRQSLVPPSSNQTAIEAVAGLTLSPDGSAHFTTPEPATDKENILLWQARMEMSGKTMVRALYAPGMADRLLTLGATLPEPTTWRSSLSANQRAELALSMSAYGVPALRRLVEGPGGAVEDSRGQVFRPEKPYYLLRASDPGGEDKDHNLQEGFFHPRGFDEAAIDLSSCGGSVQLKWQGEPPSPVVNLAPPTPKPFFRGLNVENYTHRTALGWDAFVQIAEKGFLFPLGHRATLITITQREFHPFRGNADRLHPTGYLIQREFIVCRKPEKMFPALNQPFASRDFPAEKVELVTTVTEQLHPKREMIWANATLKKPDGSALKPAGEAFWPRRLNGDDVVFHYKVNGTDQQVSSPLLFVNNEAAHTPLTMWAVVQLYAKFDAARRTATHGDAERSYAPAGKPGDTSYPTDNWLLSARGRALSGASGVDPAAEFTFDALMEGADQPPFYPWVERATIVMSSVDRLLGRVQGPIAVAFYDGYRRNAFDRSANPSEVYLDVLGPRIELDFSGQGGDSGGVAKPSATLAAVSRSIGLVGGKVRSSSLAAIAGPGAAAKSTTTVDLQFDTEQAKAGMLDPAAFFGDAKLLGLIALKDVLQIASILGAPRLTQAFEYASGLTSALRAAMRESAIEVVKAIAAVRKEADDALKKWHPDLRLDDLYPELAKRLETAKVAAARLEKADQLSEADLVGAVTLFVGEAKGLAAALEQVAAHPTPQIVGDLIKNVEAFRGQIGEFLRKFLDRMVEQARALATAKLVDYASQLAKEEVFESVFGEIDAAVVQNFWAAFPNIEPRRPDTAELMAAFRRIIAEPGSYAARIESTVFYQTYGRSFARVFTTIAAFLGETQQVLSWSRAGLGQAVLTAIGPAIDRHPELQKALTAIVDAVAAEIGPGDLNQVIDRATNAGAGLVAGVQTAFERAVKEAEAARHKLYNDVQRAYKEAAANAAREVDIPELERKFAEAQRVWEEIQATSTALTADPAAVRKRVADVIRTELLVAKRRLEEVVATAKADIAEKFQAVLDAVVDHAEDALRFSALAAETRTVTTVIAQAQRLAVDILPPTAAVLGRLEVLLRTVDEINLPATLPPELRAQLFAQVSSTRQHLARAIEWVVELEKIRRVLAKPAGTWKEEKALITLISRTLEVRRRASEHLREACGSFNQLVNSATAAATQAPSHAVILTALRDKAQAAWPEVTKLVLELTAAAGFWKDDASAQARWTAARTAVTDLIRATKSDAAKAAIQGALDAFQAQAQAAFDAWSTAVKDPRTWETASRQLAALMSGSERALVASVLETIRVSGGAALKLAAPMLEILSTVMNALLVAHNEVTGVLQTVITAAEPAGSTAGTLAAILAKPGRDTLQRALTAVKDDAQRIDALVKDIAVVRNLLPNPVPEKPDAATLLRFASARELKKILDGTKALRDQWRNPGMGLAIAAKIVARLAEQLIHGQLGALFDVKALQRELEKMIRQTLPHEAILKYDWSTSLGSFPADDPIFEIEAARPPLDDPEFVQPMGERGPADLALSSEVRINFETGRRVATAKGEIRPFNIRLLGSTFDLLTIKFKGARFLSAPGQGTRLHAPIHRVEIGSALEFIRTLQEFMSPGEGNGPYVAPNLFPPGIEAGYRFASDLIQVGSVQFINVAVSVSMLLPFDDRQAEFRFAFASKDRPFLISQPPYGGGGFVALTANAKGITSFEISLEFGAVAAIKFGPLRGQGRITAGIYLRSSPAERVLEGFVHAVGEGHIACFGISVCIEVKVRQENGGAMIGSSTYSVSFKVGFASVSYSFTAAYKIQGGRNERAAERPPPEARDPVVPIVHVAAESAYVVCNVPRKTTEWGAYRSRLAIEKP